MIERNSWAIPTFRRVPVAQLIDKKYGAAWRESMIPDKASASNELQRPAIFNELERYASAHPQPALGGLRDRTRRTTRWSTPTETRWR